MKIKKGNITPKDLVFQFLPVNYSETFESIFESDKDVTPDDLMVDFWTDRSPWINTLFKIRDIIVRPFGLQSGSESNKELIECIRTGKTYKMISIPAKSEIETVMRLTDSHLTAYISLQSEKIDPNHRTIKISTLVQFHNLLGKVYFYSIFPFHYIIVTGKMKQKIRKLASDK